MHVSSRGIFQSGQDEKYDAKRQRNRHSQSPVVPGANLKTGKETLIFQWITIFPVSHSSKMSPVRLPNFEGDKWETSAALAIFWDTSYNEHREGVAGKQSVLVNGRPPPPLTR